MITFNLESLLMQGSAGITATEASLSDLSSVLAPVSLNHLRFKNDE